MPRVPTYSGPQVQSAALQGGIQDAGAYTAGTRQLAQFGQALGQAGDVALRAAAIEESDQAFRVETGLKARWVQFEQQLRTQRQGENAKGYAAEVQKWWQENGAAAANEVQGPRARSMISRSLQISMAEGLAGATRWEAQEMDKAQAGAYAASQQVEIQRAVQTADPASAAAARGLIGERVAQQAAIKGWGADVVAAETLRYTNQLHTDMVNQLMNIDPQRAKSYFDANLSEIASGQHARMRAVLDGAAMEQDAQQRADALATLSYEEQLTKVSEITDPKLREKTRSFVKMNHDDARAIRAERERAASDQVWQLVANGTGYSQLPKAALAQMDGKDRMQITQHYQAEARRRASEAEGKSVKTDMTVLERIYAMPRDEFLQTRISALSDRLSRGDMEELIKRQATMRDPNKAPQAFTSEQQISIAMDQMKLGGSGNQEKRGEFRSQVGNAFRAFANENGRTPNEEERQRILDRLTTEVVTHDGFLWDTKKRAYTLTPDERDREQKRRSAEVSAPAPVPERRSAPLVQNISGGDRTLITQALRAEGVTVTEDAIQRRYQEVRGSR